MPTECAENMRVKDQPLALLFIHDGPNLSEVINCKKYSSLQRLLRVTSYMLWLVDNLRGDRHCNTNRSKGASDSGEKGLVKAECLWIKITQKQLVSDIGFANLKSSLASSWMGKESGDVVDISPKQILLSI